MPNQLDRQEEAMDVDPYQIYRSTFRSKTIRTAWEKSYGDQFWEPADTPLSQATNDDIKFLTEQVRPSSEMKFADLGCGGGCIGRYLASEFGADVDGIDVNPLAVCMAEELALARKSAMQHHLRFKTGDITKTGWIDNSFDGAVSMDVLLFVANKPAALREIFRILKPGARFVGMTWELRAVSAALTAPRCWNGLKAMASRGLGEG
jgi:cyclopropane fatty-acyl-phospholipid synthase-like methyltransferase